MIRSIPVIPSFGRAFGFNLRSFLKMASIERIKQNSKEIKQTINELRNEINILNTQYNNLMVKYLREENTQLVAAVDAAKAELIRLEIANGVAQISVPNQSLSAAPMKSLPVEPQSVTADAAKVSEAKPKKEKKTKEPVQAAEEPPIDIGRLDLRVAKVEDVQKHPDADTLYVLKINCGEEKPRTVCSGLVKHVRMEEIRDRNVVLLCNLKPVKMRGISSEAMVMCASSEQGVEILIPPAGCMPGDHVYCEGYIRQPDVVMNPKKKIFETVAPDLHTDGNLRACYKEVPWTIGEKGHVLAKSLANVPVK